ncbi:M56 family metallopeptidase [Intestinimonas sp.]|uniref:M56 family metallopeptidase n=1 Tax=Intestinimonas sp. TaxID=1965293 RepID=UPI00260A53DF|nr:M56 family metallopeptidase [Intestinimonas sp.]
MEAIFLRLVNLSLSAGWLVLAILVLRLFLRRAPRWSFCLLWGLVGLRLLCPVSIESPLSLLPSAQPLPPEILYTATPRIDSGIDAVNNVVNPILEGSLTPSPGASANPAQIWSFVLARLWLAGVLILLLYALVSYVRLRRRVATATLLRENIRETEGTDTPFVLGLLRPTIYLPYGLSEGDLPHVIAHERAHIRRGDHWWKALGFLILSVYWFHPLLWVAYVLLCRDIEGACDERVIRELDREERREYAAALLHCGVRRRTVAACPLAFGEVGVKARIKAVMSYRRPGVWLAAAALAACAVAAVCFLTDPPVSPSFPMEGNQISDLDPQEIVEQIAKRKKLDGDVGLYVNGDQFDLLLTSDFCWDRAQAVRFSYVKDQTTYSAQLRLFTEDSQYFVTESQEWPEQNRVFQLQTYLEALKHLPQEEIRRLSPDADGYSVLLMEEGTPGDDARSITYGADGVEDLDGWYIHLAVAPLHADHSSSADEMIHLFYGAKDGSASPVVAQWVDYTQSPDEMDWEGVQERQLPQFPGVTFRYTPYEVTADAGEGEMPAVLIEGMPIWGVWFTDLTGDGLPELCATLSMGSGLIDNRVLIYDYAGGASYGLEDRGRYDYALRYSPEEDRLYVDKRDYQGGALVSTGPLVFRDGVIQVLDGDGGEGGEHRR